MLSWHVAIGCSLTSRRCFTLPPYLIGDCFCHQATTTATNFFFDNGRVGQSDDRDLPFIGLAYLTSPYLWLHWSVGAAGTALFASSGIDAFQEHRVCTPPARCCGSSLVLVHMNIVPFWRFRPRNPISNLLHKKNSRLPQGCSVTPIPPAHSRI